MDKTCQCGWPLPTEMSITVAGRSNNNLTIICWYKCPNCRKDFNVGKEVSGDILNYHGKTSELEPNALEPRGFSTKEIPVL